MIDTDIYGLNAEDRSAWMHEFNKDEIDKNDDFVKFLASYLLGYQDFKNHPDQFKEKTAAIAHACSQLLGVDIKRLQYVSVPFEGAAGGEIYKFYGCCDLLEREIVLNSHEDAAGDSAASIVCYLFHELRHFQQFQNSVANNEKVSALIKNSLENSVQVTSADIPCYDRLKYTLCFAERDAQLFSYNVLNNVLSKMSINASLICKDKLEAKRLKTEIEKVKQELERTNIMYQENYERALKLNDFIEKDLAAFSDRIISALGFMASEDRLRVWFDSCHAGEKFNRTNASALYADDFYDFYTKKGVYILKSGVLSPENSKLMADKVYRQIPLSQLLSIPNRKMMRIFNNQSEGQYYGQKCGLEEALNRIENFGKTILSLAGKKVNVGSFARDITYFSYKFAIELAMKGKGLKESDRKLLALIKPHFVGGGAVDRDEFFMLLKRDCSEKQIEAFSKSEAIETLFKGTNYFKGQRVSDNSEAKNK